MKADNFALEAPHESAIYLPALSTGYIDQAEDGLAPDRVLPDGFAMEDTAFWTGNSRMFNHKFCLHSVGSHKVKATLTNTLFDRSRGNYTTVGDSGGYQIGKGTLNGLVDLKTGMGGKEAAAAWTYKNADTRHWIIDTLKTHFDYAVTIDMALWFATPNGAKSPFHRCTERQLLDMTVKNLELIERYGLNERAKWLNVLQGTNPQNTIEWWDAVKHFQHGGWSLAGATGWRGGLHNMLMLLLTMRDEHAFDAGQDWLHMLGVSQPLWHMYFTASQNILRKQSGNHNLQFSYDSSSPILSAGKTDCYAYVPELEADEKTWKVTYKQLDAVRSNASNSEKAFPQNTSPIGKLFEMRHLVIDDSDFEGRRIDAATNQIMACHNIWVYLDFARRIQDIAFTTKSKRKRIPQRYLEGLEVLEGAFEAENWRDYIDTNKQTLDNVAKLQYEYVSELDA